MDFESDYFSFLLDLNSDSIINLFFARGIRKRFKHINILLNQSIFKLRFFTSFIFIDIIRKQIKIVFFKACSDKRIFERDFFRYNKVLNKVFR